MTFTEAAVEVLRRMGKPLHYSEIAEAAVRENLLSHVGQDPEVTMGQRLAAMAKREDERRVVAIAPDGTFALLEWSVPPDQIVEPIAPPLQPAEDPAEPLYRPREREPRPIHAQARRRLEALQPAVEETEEDKRRERRKFPPPAEVAFEWLAQRQSGAPLAELCAALAKKGLLSDALVRDPSSLVQALLEDNRRRTEAGRKPAFIVDGERCTLVEFPPPSAVLEEARAPHAVGRPMSAAQLAAESRRAVVRALRRRLADLETGAFERLCAQLLEKMGMRDVRVAKRSKEGPLYLSRQRRGVSDLRTAVKLVRGSREISRSDVQELRKDLAHYSAQMGLVLAPGDAGRDARAEAAAAGLAPVALYAGECLAEEFCNLRVGVKVQVVELADVDEALFAEVARPAQGQDRDRRDRLGRDEPHEAEATPEGEERGDADTKAERETRPEREAKPDREGTPEREAKPDREGRAEREAKPNREGRPDREGRAEREAKPDRDGRPEWEARPERAARPEREAKPDREAETGLDARSEPEAGSAPEAPSAVDAHSPEATPDMSADMPAETPAAQPRPPVPAPPEPVREPERESRRRPARREQAQRATNAAEQAWGQPIGTPRRAQPPSPLVFE
ncbi:MAG: HTH domain-containing protein, partial [Myxococcales bacterium]